MRWCTTALLVNKLKEAGAVFVEELDEVPDDSIVIFSAHGVAKVVREMAKSRALKVFDATCPLVTKVHMEVHRASRRARSRAHRPCRPPRGDRHHGTVREQ